MSAVPRLFSGMNYHILHSETGTMFHMILQYLIRRTLWVAQAYGSFIGLDVPQNDPWKEQKWLNWSGDGVVLLGGPGEQLAASLTDQIPSNILGVLKKITSGFMEEISWVHFWFHGFTG